MDSRDHNLLSNAMENIFAKHNKSISAFQNGYKGKKKGISKRELELALTILLVELASSDQNFELPEYNLIVAGVNRIFGTNRTEVSALVNEATLAIANLRGSAKFASLLKENLSEEQRHAVFELVENLIEADGKIDGFEIYLRNKFATLLDIKIPEDVS